MITRVRTPTQSSFVRSPVRIVNDPDAIQLSIADFESGSLKKLSNIRPNRLFTADERVISYRAGHLKAEKTLEVVERVVEIVRR